MQETPIIFRELPAGTPLANGKYMIESVLGVGGFGITYKAKHATLNQYFAIKEFFINGYCVRNSQHLTIELQGMDANTYLNYRNKFVEEAQTLTKFDHPNIVKVTDIFDENGTSYIAMLFVKGKTLQQKVEQEGILKHDIALNLISQIAEATGYIHKQAILHRDIKPDNIMITPENRAVLIDFGAAREFIHDQTQGHTSILTQGYAPIEQYTSSAPKDAYSDIYALGAVYYFCVTGVRPMDAANRFMEEMKEPKTLNPELSDSTNKIIMKAMQLQHQNRHQNIEEFMKELLKDQSNNRGEINKKLIFLISGGFILAFICGLSFFWITKPDKQEQKKTTFTLPGTTRTFTYEGEFKDDTIPHGKGKAESNFFYYEGDFVEGRIEGVGKWIYKAGSNKGDIKEGRFFQNELDSGVFISVSGRSRTEGTFVLGTIVLIDGLFIDSVKREIHPFKNQNPDTKNKKTF